MRRLASAKMVALLFGCLIAAPAAGATPDGPMAQHQAEVDQLATALRERYVYPDVGAKAADRITGRLKSGAYDQLGNPAQFAAQLTNDIFAVAHDKHMWVDSRGGRSEPPPLLAPSDELGVVRADRLAGGIGYIEVIAFPPLAQFKPVIDRAMSSLQGSKALILDDRRNSGGDPGSVAYLVSFLVPSGAHINDIVSRTPKTTQFNRKSFSAEATPVNFAGVPMVLLTSGSTFSGGEEFAYDMQNLTAATIVGEVTGGGANPTATVPLGPDMVASIPFGRAENPVTKSNWEGKGVKPDVQVPASDALKAALTRLGGPAVADISAASQSRVFTPRSTALPGSEAALRRLIAWLASNEPDYSAMSPQLAEATRQQLPALHKTMTTLGAIKSIAFFGVGPQGGDSYNVTFAGGLRRISVMTGDDGKIVGAGISLVPGAPS